MKLSAAVTSLLVASASAFGTPKAPAFTPDATKFAYGIPGSIDPVPEFDPLGYAKDADYETIKQYREAELQHGRVS